MHQAQGRTSGERRPAGSGTRAGTPAGPLGQPGTLLDLQRTAGNRAVAGLIALQRFGSSSSGSGSGSGSQSGSTSNDGVHYEGEGRYGDLYRFVQEPQAPDPERARVDVNSTEISMLGYGHAFVVHTDPTGIRRYYRGGPTKQAFLGGDFGALRTWHGDFVPGTVDWTHDPDHSVTVAHGSAAVGKDSSLESALAKVEAAHAAYHPESGPNSNSTARYILEKSGLPARKPQAWLPAWEVEIPGT